MTKAAKNHLGRMTLAGILIGLFFLGLRINALMSGEQGKVIPSVIAGLRDSGALALSSAFFLIALMGLHSALALFWYYGAAPLIRKLNQGRNTTALLFLGLLLVVLWVMLANSIAYPASMNALMVARGDHDTSWSLLLTFGLVSLVLATAMLGGLALRIKQAAHDGHLLRTLLLPTLLLASVLAYTVWPQPRPPAPVTRTQPDIILLGVDGVRPDHVGIYGHYTPTLTPAMDHLLSQSTLFRNAWSPLARTQPAWASILTGLTPSGHGAVFNLVHPDRVRHHDTLGHQLGKLGYHRIYAIDETRFSNMDESYGYDERITPPIGAIDFLVGSIADIPLLNLLSGTPVGRWLFPTLHMNRAMALVYKPDLFDRHIRNALYRTDPAQPLFLSAHFELPHWPYTWANSFRHNPVMPPDLMPITRTNYVRTVSRVDQQVAALLDALQRSGRLDNAILFLFSDHGETFENFEPPWTWRGAHPPTARVVLNRYGHGTSVANDSQMRAVFGVRGYGPQALPSAGQQLHTEQASLIDIRPTLEAWLELPPLEDTHRDGRSLMTALRQGSDPTLADRILTFETGFSLPSIERGNPDAREVIDAGSAFYATSPEGRLIIKSEWLPFLVAQKQRATFIYPWTLAAFPSDDTGTNFHVRLLNLNDRTVWDPATSDPLPPEAPIARLREALQTHFALTLPQP